MNYPTIKTKLPIDPLSDEEISRMNKEYLEQLVNNGSDILQII